MKYFIHCDIFIKCLLKFDSGTNSILKMILKKDKYCFEEYYWVLVIHEYFYGQVITSQDQIFIVGPRATTYHLFADNHATLHLYNICLRKVMS